MLLSYIELVQLVEDGVITADIDNINGASIDVCLHDEILYESKNPDQTIISLRDQQSPEMNSFLMSSHGFSLRPQQFILASTKEVFNLPNDIACEFKLRSSVARAGLNHCLAGWADPGWNGSRLTLELKNETQYHTLVLHTGMKIGQMVFYRCNPVPIDQSYAEKGRYNHTMTTTISKGL